MRIKKTHRLRIVETLEEKFCLKLTNEILMVYVASSKEDLQNNFN